MSYEALLFRYDFEMFPLILQSFVVQFTHSGLYKTTGNMHVINLALICSGTRLELRRCSFQSQPSLNLVCILIPHIFFICSRQLMPKVNKFNYLSDWVGRCKGLLALSALTCSGLDTLTDTNFLPVWHRIFAAHPVIYKW